MNLSYNNNTVTFYKGEKVVEDNPIDKDLDKFKWYMRNNERLGIYNA